MEIFTENVYSLSVITSDTIPKSYEDAICLLARWNGEGGAADLRIYAFPDPTEQVVRLIHVSDEFVDVGGVRIYKMGRSEEFPYRSAVALALPKYWERIQSGEQLLPTDWDITSIRKVWPNDRA
jgi:hypothetical protein